MKDARPNESPGTVVEAYVLAAAWGWPQRGRDLVVRQLTLHHEDAPVQAGNHAGTASGTAENHGLQAAAAPAWAVLLACLGNPDPGDMKVYCPEGKETFDDDETTEEAPS